MRCLNKMWLLAPKPIFQQVETAFHLGDGRLMVSVKTFKANDQKNGQKSSPEAVLLLGDRNPHLGDSLAILCDRKSVMFVHGDHGVDLRCSLRSLEGNIQSSDSNDRMPNSLILLAGL